jgi:hypothetical protein
MHAMQRPENLAALLVVPFLFLVWQQGSCGNNNVKQSGEDKPQHVAEGNWGGLHIIINVTEQGAIITMDCARGTINNPIEIDAQGHFDVPGTFVTETPGPVREGDDNSRAVRYSGTVKAGTMTLTIAAANSDEALGNFTLAQGKQGKIWKCL